MPRRIQPLVPAGLCAALVCCGVLAHAGQVYYENDFEQTCDAVYWASACRVETGEASLTEQNPYAGQRCAKISYHVTDGSGWCYFRVPVRIYGKFRKIKEWTLVGELMPERAGG